MGNRRYHLPGLDHEEKEIRPFGAVKGAKPFKLYRP